MISVSHLSYRYPGSPEQTLSDLSFAVPPGRIYGFLGPSGAGKSTTQKILYGVLKGYSGGVKILDRDLEHWSRRVYEVLGVALEFPRFYERLSARDNLTYYRLFYSASADRGPELMEYLGLKKDMDRPVEEFSKGMKMRLNLVRALQHDPQVLFLDEPTSGLDPIHASAVKDLLRREAEGGKTVFLTTHNMGLAQDVCHEVGFLVDGRIAASAAPDELRRRHKTGLVRVEIAARHGENTDLLSREFPLENLAGNQEFLGFLAAGRVERIRSLEPNLEEIFLTTTGRSLHESSGE